MSALVAVLLAELIKHAPELVTMAVGSIGGLFAHKAQKKSLRKVANAAAKAAPKGLSPAVTASLVKQQIQGHLAVRLATKKQTANAVDLALSELPTNPLIKRAED